MRTSRRSGDLARVRGVAVVAGTVLALAACGGKGSAAGLGGDGPPAGLGGDGASTFSGPPPCPDGASCAGGFEAGGIRYAVSCGAVRPDAVEDRVLATGVYDGNATEVRPLIGIDVHVLLAIRLDSHDCVETTVISPWTMLLVDGASDSAVQDATCRVIFEQSYATRTCAQPLNQSSGETS